MPSVFSKVSRKKGKKQLQFFMGHHNETPMFEEQNKSQSLTTVCPFSPVKNDLLIHRLRKIPVT